jgi:DNA-directed RNA polymerase specialized sigma24 family protein
LTTEAILSNFGGRKIEARQGYRVFVDEGISGESIWSDLNRQVFLGNERFVERMQKLIGGECQDVQIPKEQRRRPPPSLEQLSKEGKSRDAAIIAAYGTGGYGYAEIGAFFGLHFTTVGRIVRRMKERRQG